MTPHALTLSLGDAGDLDWAQATVAAHHYLRRPVDRRARPMCYVVRHNGLRRGLVIVGLPHATKCRGWWGYAGLPTQWQTLDLSRIWIDPDLQAGGFWCEPGEVPGFTDRRGQWRPAVATWMIREVLGRVGRDRVALWPPVYPAMPYHIRLVISYHDPAYHRGTIYRQSGAAPMFVDSAGAPVPGPAGKYGWAWRLAQPGWMWEELEGIRPRTLRLV